MEFEEALRDLGFARTEDRSAASRGSRIYAARPNRFLTYFVHTYPDGAALFTFEFAIAEYLTSVGLQVGSSEELNQFLYPRMDVRGTQDSAWLAAAMDHAEALLGAVDLVDPERPGSEVGPEPTP
ncbi:MAG: hypothetical protein LC722_01700 [Actinobacteria bacterium]|nr:hypothetical protein [Actinomycetota bacterium]